MDKLNLVILAGAGAMAAAAAGMWFSREEVVVVRPLEPSSELPRFEPVDVKALQAEGRRIAVVVPKGSDDPTDVAFLKAAKKLRNSPCNATAKAEFLAIMPAYARKNLRNNLAALRRGEEGRPQLSPLAAQASEYFNYIEIYGFVTRAEYRNAMKQVTPGLGLSIAANEEAGPVVNMSMGESACERHRTGEPQPRLSWEPEEDSRDERRR
jgi:hypothetical protein